MSREVPTVLQAIVKYESRECSTEGTSWRITLNSIVFDRSLAPICHLRVPFNVSNISNLNKC